MPAQISPSDIYSWFNEPLAVYSAAAGATFYSLMTDTGGLGIGKYDHANQTYEVGNPRADNTPLAVADTNNPAVLVLNTGKLLAAYADAGKCWSSLSTNAYDVRGGWTETQITDGSTYYTAFAHLCQTTDSQNTIWWFFRDGAAGGRPLAFRVNQAGGAGGSWTANASTVKLFANTIYRVYCRIATSGRRIDILFNDGLPAELSTTSLYHAYIEVSPDGTQFSVYKADNTLIDTWAISGGTGTVNGKTLPLTPADATKIYDGATNKCWVMDAQYVQGTLYACYSVYTTTSVADDTHKYRRATYNGSAWTHEDVCHAGDSSSPATVGRTPHWLYPDGTTNEPHYSPGICLDPNTTDVVYVGKKYGSSDVRVETWAKSGAWAKTADLTGASGNGRVNARPFPVLYSNPANVRWWSASPYALNTSYTAGPAGLLVPLTLARTTKTSSPIWTPSKGLAGTRAFYLIREGSGLSVADIAGGYNGTITGGSLTWGTGTYGAELSGFTSAIAVVADSLAASGFFNTGNFPKWIAVLYKSLTSATGQYLVGFGNSADNDPIFGVTVNNATDNQAGGNYRDLVQIQNQVNAAKTRDAGYHTLFVVAESASMFRAYHDATLLGSATQATTAVTYDRFTLGALRRATQGSQASGSTLIVVAAGSGAAPSPLHVHADFISGQLLGTWTSAPPAQSAPLLFLFGGGVAA